MVTSSGKDQKTCNSTYQLKWKKQNKRLQLQNITSFQKHDGELKKLDPGVVRTMQPWLYKTQTQQNQPVLEGRPAGPPGEGGQE